MGTPRIRANANVIIAIVSALTTIIVAIISNGLIRSSSQDAHEKLDSISTQADYVQTQVDKSTNALTNVPIGTIVAYAGGDISILPNDWLICDGSSKAVKDYPLLAKSLGNQWGKSGEPNFNVPDLNGEFLRGIDIGAGNDPDASKRIDKNGEQKGDVGSYQGDQFQGHFHVVNPFTVQNGGTGAVAGSGNLLPGKQLTAETIISDGMNGTPRYGSETRPKNACVYWVIKAK